MTNTDFQITPGRWYGLQTLPGTPVEGACWPNSPVFVTEAIPLKTGAGLLRVKVVEVLQPVGPRTRTIVLKVRQRQTAYLVGTFNDAAGVDQVAMLSEISEEWLKGNCHDWWRRFPMKRFADPDWVPEGISVQDYLSRAFPGGPDQMGRPLMLHETSKKPMPARHSKVMIRYEFDEMDSYLVRRGFLASVMEEKWNAEFAANTLRLYRSWTGNLIYEIPMTARGARLYAGSITINRDPDEYSADDDTYEKDLSAYVVGRVVLGLPFTMPGKPELPLGEAAMAQWSLMGKMA